MKKLILVAMVGTVGLLSACSSGTSRAEVDRMSTERLESARQYCRGKNLAQSHLKQCITATYQGSTEWAVPQSTTSQPTQQQFRNAQLHCVQRGITGSALIRRCMNETMQQPTRVASAQLTRPVAAQPAQPARRSNWFQDRRNEKSAYLAQTCVNQGMTGSALKYCLRRERARISNEYQRSRPRTVTCRRTFNTVRCR